MIETTTPAKALADTLKRWRSTFKKRDRLEKFDFAYAEALDARVAFESAELETLEEVYREQARARADGIGWRTAFVASRFFGEMVDLAGDLDVGRFDLHPILRDGEEAEPRLDLAHIGQAVVYRRMNPQAYLGPYLDRIKGLLKEASR